MNNLVLGALPSLTNLDGYLTTEVQIGVGIVALILCIILWAKQQVGPLIGVILMASFIFFMANDPERIFNSVGELFSKIFGG
ncbi:TcpD family membrane protein [Enterococcus sp. LJL128]